MVRKLNDPIFIAAWPGMGHVAVTAAYYLISKLQMEFRAEYAASELFEADHVSIESGLVQTFRYPKNQVFSWLNPNEGSDLLVFIAESQPPHGGYDYCRKLIDYAQREGVSSVYTFAALATVNGLPSESRVVGAATDKNTLHEFVENEVGLLRAGNIAGMNGILLGVVAERKIKGGCLLGEMPGMLMNLPYPKASIAVLTAFSRLTKIEIELTELKLEANRMDSHLNDMIARAQRLEQQNAEIVFNNEDSDFIPDPNENDLLTDEERERLEKLFESATNDRSKAFELKRELDRLGVFRDYEDRFLDLFKQDPTDNPDIEEEP